MWSGGLARSCRASSCIFFSFLYMHLGLDVCRARLVCVPGVGCVGPQVRGLMRATARDPAAAAALAACDAVRDVSLPPLGVRLEDLRGGGSRWKLDDPQVGANTTAQRAWEGGGRRLQS